MRMRPNVSGDDKIDSLTARLDELALVPKFATDSLCSDMDLQTRTLEALLTDFECSLDQAWAWRSIDRAGCVLTYAVRASVSFAKMNSSAASTPCVDALPAMMTARFDAIGKGIGVGSRRCYFGPKIAIFRRLQRLAVGQP
jgi:hypothetical protein